MSEPFLGELRLVAFNFAPKGWAFCNGALLPINQNQPLFSLLGTTFGGDGRTTFGLPNMQGRVPIGFDDGAYPLGMAGGETVHSLTVNELPAHTHQATVAAAATVVTPGSSSVIAQPGKAAFAATPTTTLSPATVAVVGGSQPHENRAPSLVLTYVIALSGIFPSRS
jgi:microcystin-dependent protein